MLQRLRNRKLLLGLVQKSLLIICLVIVFVIVNNVYFMYKISSQFYSKADNDFGLAIEYLESRVNYLYKTLYSYEDFSAIISLSHTKNQNFDYKKASDVKDVMNLVKVNISASPEVSNIFIYFNDCKLMIDRNGSSTADIFEKYALNASFSQTVREEIHRQLNAPYTMSESKIKMIFDKTYNLVLFKSKKFSVIFQLNNNINKQLSLMIDPTNVYFTASGTNDSLFASNAVKREHMLNEQQKASGHYYTLFKQGTAYDLQYTAYYNKDSLFYNQFNLYLFSISLCVVFVIVISYILFTLKKQLYNPLERIIQKHALTADGRMIDEYQLVEENLKKYSDSIQEYETKQKETEEEIELSALNHILFDPGSNPLFEKALKTSQPVCYCVLSLDIEDQNNRRDTECCKQFDLQLRSCCHANPLFSMTYAVVYLIKLTGGKEGYQNFIKGLKQCVSGLQAPFVICGVSEPWESISHLKEAYKHSQQALLDNRYEAANTKPSICLYHHTPAVQEDALCSPEQERLLINSTLTYHSKETAALLQTMLKEGKSRTVRGHRKQMIRLYDLLCLFLTDKGMDLEEFFNETFEDFGDIIVNSYYLQPLTEAMISYFEKYILLCNDDKGNLLQKMTHFIDENIDRNISLQELADEMNLSYAYMGRYFREKMHMSFIEYVQKKKIEIAQMLLVETDLNIVDISERTGFNTANTFFRTFKAITGLTPNEFRVKNAPKRLVK